MPSLSDHLWDIFGQGTGRSFYVRDFKNAYRFRPDVDPVRQKFQGYVNFIFNRDLFGTLFGNPTGENEFRTTISSLVRTAELPSVNFRTQTMNEYNRKKIVNTGVEYQPVNITVFDTVGNEWLTTLMKYFAYHYMDPRNKQNPGDRDIEGYIAGIGGEEFIGTQFGIDQIFDSNRAGYNTNVTSKLFERIDYVLYHGNKGVQYSIINPVLTSFKPGTIDYSDSAAMDFQLQFEYERFTVYNNVNFSLSEEDVDRFENASGIEGPTFIDDGAADLALQQRELSILGQTENFQQDRGRSAQATIATQTTAQSIGDRGVSIDSSGQLITTPGIVPGVDPGAAAVASASVDPRTGPSGLPATYGPAAVFAPGNNSGGTGNPLTDLILDVADNSITAAIAGGDIEDAAIRTALGSVTTIIGQTINDAINPSSPNQGGSA